MLSPDVEEAIQAYQHAQSELNEASKTKLQALVRLNDAEFNFNLAAGKVLTTSKLLLQTALTDISQVRLEVRQTLQPDQPLSGEPDEE